MLSIDATLVVQLVNFIVFLAILNVVFFRPVGAAIAKRRAYIDGLAHDFESLQNDLKTLRGQADDMRAAARRRGDEIVTSARASASGEADGIVAAATQQAQGIIDEAQRQVAGEVTAARGQEPAIVAALSSQMVATAFGSEAA